MFGIASLFVEMFGIASLSVEMFGIASLFVNNPISNHSFHFFVPYKNTNKQFLNYKRNNSAAVSFMPFVVVTED